MFWLRRGGWHIWVHQLPNRLAPKPAVSSCWANCVRQSSGTATVPSENEKPEDSEVPSTECSTSGLQNGEVNGEQRSASNVSTFRGSPNVRRFRMQLRSTRTQSSFAKTNADGASNVSQDLKSLRVDSYKDDCVASSSTGRGNNGQLNQKLNRCAEELVSVLRKAGDRGVQEEGVENKSLSRTDAEKEGKSVHPNRFRKVLYTEGELDASDLSLPPSRSNPHPFDPSSNPDLLPPTHSRSLVQYVNHLPLLQYLVELGVNLLTVEKTTTVGRQLVRLDWDKDVVPKLVWLVKLGVPLADLGSYLTRNPFFLIQDLDNMKARVSYLYSKNFKKEQIAKLIIAFRYWLNMDVHTVDARLGWIQKSFRLTGDQVRSLVIMEPRIFMFGVAPLQRMVMMLSKEFLFTESEVKQMLLQEPRLFLQEMPQVAASYLYLHFSMGLTNGQIVEYPLALRCPVASIRRRHEFLAKLGRDKYSPGTPDCVSLASLLHPSDKYFAVNVARSFLVSYNSFLKKY